MLPMARKVTIVYLFILIILNNSASSNILNNLSNDRLISLNINNPIQLNKTDSPRNNRRLHSKAATLSCSCGVKSKAITRIVGGEETEVGEWPWMAVLFVAVKNDIKALCGGTLISDRHVITAGHCMENSNSPSDYTVRVLEHDLESTKESNHIDTKLSKFRVHRRYGHQGSDANDIALLELKTPLSLTSNNDPLPICLPSKTEKYKKTSAIVAGWGKTSYEAGIYSDVLRHVTVSTMTNSKCKKKSKYGEGVIANSMICARAKNKDACLGDSGGPLMTERSSDGRYELIGIVSFGIGCAERVYPGIYARVTKFLSWIARKTKSGSFCAP